MKKLFSACLLIFSLLLANVAPAFAASHYGDAVFRDGTLLGATWHAAINNYYTVGQSVVHAPGGSSVVQRASWTAFISTNTITGKPNNYQGPPQYRSGMTESDLNNILNTALYLADRANVTYNAIDLMQGSTSGTYISPGGVTQLRCDGLVEYCYEWYNWPVLTDGNGNWDITNINSRPYHSTYYRTWEGDTFNPVTQWSYMDPHYD